MDKLQQQYNEEFKFDMFLELFGKPLAEWSILRTTLTNQCIGNIFFVYVFVYSKVCIYNKILTEVFVYIKNTHLFF